MQILDLAHDREKSLVIKLAFPAMMGQLVNVCYSIVDRIFIGNLPQNGDLALAAVGICAPLLTLLSSVAYLVGTGGAPQMMLKLGAGKKEEANAVLNNAFLLLLGFAIMAPLLTACFLEPLLASVGASDILLPLCKAYMEIYLPGAFFAIIAAGLNQFVTAQGYSSLAMISMLLGAGINVLLDPLFIYVLNLGIRGAALATAIAQVVTCLFNVLFLCSRHSNLRIQCNGYDRRIMKRILAYGFSPFLIFLTDSLVVIAANASLKTFGGMRAESMIAAYTIACSVFQLTSMPLLGISGGTQGLLSYNFGAGAVQRVKTIEKEILKRALIFTTFSFAMAMCFNRPLCSIFTSKESLLELSAFYVRLLMTPVVLLSFQYCFVDGLTALGYPLQASFLSLNRKIMVIVLCFVLPLFFSADSAIVAGAIGDAVGSLVTAATFLMLFPKLLKDRATSIKA